MFKKLVVSIVLSLMLLCTGALAEAQFSWDAEYPEIPALRYHVYRKEGPELDSDVLVAALWNGNDYSRTEQENVISYRLEASQSVSGFREDVYVWENGQFSHIVDRTQWPAWTDIGGPEVAYATAEDWLAAWLPAEYFALRGIMADSYDEDGNPVDHYYSLSWLQEVEPGVAAYEPGVRVEYYSCGVNSAHINWSCFVPAPGSAPEYLTAHQALQSLNYAAANIDPAHVCTSFDDPDDRLVAIAPVMSDRFNEEENYTLCWQFTIQDAQKGYLRTVLVDAVSGDIYDDHDGRLDGCF